MDPVTDEVQAGRPNILVILTDQLRYPPVYESEELQAYRREHCAGQDVCGQMGFRSPVTIR